MSSNQRADAIRREVRTDEATLSVKYAEDGTRTVATVHVGSGPHGKFNRIGTGVAVRRKGDSRRPLLGRTLALARALQDAADTYAARAEEALNG